MAAEATKILTLGAITCNFLGIPLDEMGGWGEGQGGIKLEKQDPSFTIKRGADGSTVRSKTYSRLWKITLTILQTAAMNGVLSAILKADEETENGSGVGPILIADRNGNSVFSGSEAWIEGWPNTSFMNEAQNNEWVIMVANGRPFWGGS